MESLSMEKQSFKGRKRGFTLAELLIVIAILVILIGLGVTGFLALRRNIVIAKYDDLAREIYVAAQNQLARLNANGMDRETAAALQGAAGLSGKPGDYEKDDWDKVAKFYHHAPNDADVMELLLPLGTVGDDVRSNGYYVIEYNAQANTVYGVFYAEKSFDYAGVSATEGMRESREARKKVMVGYYGGSAVERDPIIHCEVPELEIINENELRLNLLHVPTDVDILITISDGEHETEVVPEYVSGDLNSRTVLLDSILEKDKHFWQLFGALTPGRDLTITVTYEKQDHISSRACVTTNSLFATREPGAQAGEDVVTLAWARHLQNLEQSVSHLDDDAIATARQTEHIQWEEMFGDFVSIRNENANDKLMRFEGSNLEIRDLKGENGLFAVTKAGMRLSGIRIVNPVINASASAPVGALVGSAGEKTEITSCAVYSNQVTADNQVDYDAYAACFVNGGGAVTGGLVGTGTGLTVTNSFAALPAMRGHGGGSLIGDASGCTITNSYANCDDLPAGFSYFTGGEDNTIAHCYAVGNVASKEGGGFSSDDNAVTDSYFAVSHRVFADRWEDNEELAVTEFSYTVAENTWLTTDQEGMEDAVKDWAGNWERMIAPLSHPYREYLDGEAYPYPAIGALDHYGSWPDGDGTVELKITMELLNNQGAGYAIFAGQVVVTDLDRQDEDGNALVLFDSENHKKANGEFDGKDTVQVAPGTKVRIETRKEEAGYEYVNTVIENRRYTVTTVEYTVNRKTEAVVTFRQNAFPLTGKPAVDKKETQITGGSYDIDLTSPLKTLTIRGAQQSELVETGSIVTARPKVPGGYIGSVAWYTPAGQNGQKDRTYLTQEENGSYVFAMPPRETDLHVMYTDQEAFFQIQCYLMDTDGRYPADGNPTWEDLYRCGLGSQINQSMINAMAESSGLPLVIDGERVRYLAKAEVTTQNSGSERTVFSIALRENGSVAQTSDPYLSREGETSENQPYLVKIYIARKQYNVSVTADEHITGVRFGDSGEFKATDRKKFYYGASVTVQAKTDAGYRFTYWDPQDSRFMMSAEERYTFQVPQFDLDLRATAALDRYLVTVNLLENDESWLYSDASRQADPISLTLVNSRDPNLTYPMQILTEDSISYAMQAVVPAVPEYESGYYLRVNYKKSGQESWIYASGSEDGGDTDNEKLLVYVRDGAVEKTVKFFSVSYYPNKEYYSGSTPKGGTYPMYYHLRVEGNSGLLRNQTDNDKIFSGWKDHYTLGTGSETLFTGGESLMITRRTDMFAQWVDHLAVTYHAGDADGGWLPADGNNYQVGETVTIQWGSLTRKGYRFLGWSTQKDAVAPEFTKDNLEYTLKAVQLHLYPVWELEEYTIAFYDTEGKLLEEEQYTITGKHYGDKITAPGLTFTPPEGSTEVPMLVGWALSKGGEVAYREGEEITVTGDCKLYACSTTERVEIRYMSADGATEYKVDTFGKGIPGYLNCVPEIGGVSTPVTAWSTQPNGKGTLYFCAEDGRSEKAYAFTEDTTVYAVTGKVYNYNEQLWFETLGEAVRSDKTVDDHTLIVYRDTEEPYNIWFHKSLYVLSSGNRTVRWKKDATAWNDTNIVLNKETAGEFVGCMNVSNNGAAVSVSFGKSNRDNLVAKGSTLTFDANRQSRVISLGSGATFHMYDGVTLTNGYRDGARSGNGTTPANRTGYGGGVYAGAGAVFYMHGGTVSYCEAVSGGGVYLYTGSKMYMGDMVRPTAYSATATYYQEATDETLGETIYLNASGISSENYKQCWITAGNPQICYNKSTHDAGGDGGGGLLMLDLKNGDLILYRGSINNNETSANGGGIMTDSGPTGETAIANQAKLRIYEVDISHNTAAGNGGGIFQWQGTVYVYNSTIRQNRAANGGGIYLNQIKNNLGHEETCNVEFYFGDISDNEAAGNGGGVSGQNSAQFYLKGGNLCRNSAQNGGGAYLGGRSSLLQFEDGTVADNTASVNGGGVFTQGTIEMSGGTLDGNHALNYGGGIYYQNGKMAMTGGTVCDNDARYLGGGIMVGGEFTISGGSLYGNTDTDYPPNNHKNDEDNVNPGPNDIYLMGDNKITIPEGGISLSGEERIAVDCERDESERFRGNHIPYQFAIYSDSNDFKEMDELYFTYYGTRSTDHYKEHATQNKNDLMVVSHMGIEGDHDVGLYLVEDTGDPRTRVVTLNANFGEEAQMYSLEGTVNDSIVLHRAGSAEVFVREGYYLAGWARTPDAREEQYELYYDVVADVWRRGYQGGTWTEESPDPEYTVKDYFSQTLYAMWRPCVAVYELGEEAPKYGVTIQDTSVGPHVTLLNPEPTEYEQGDKTFRFQHWVDSDGNEYLPTQQLDLQKNLRLTAVWEERTTDELILTFYFNGGTSATQGELRREIPVKKGDAYTADIEITRANKILMGWATRPDATGKEYEKNATFTNVEADLTLYAVWADAVSVRYDVNGGIEEGQVDATYKGGPITILDFVPTRKGYDFLGWALDKDATEGTYTAGDTFEPVNEDVTLYAVWEKDPTATFYQVTFDLDGGSGTGFAPTEVFAGDSFTLPDEIPEKAGYVFGHWEDEKGAKLAPGGKTEPVMADVTFTAHWKVLHTLTFDLNGGNLDGSMNAVKRTVPEGDNLSLHEIGKPVKGGYFFKGWADSASAGTPGYADTITTDADRTVYAVWAEAVTVSFAWNLPGQAETYATVEAEKGTAYVIGVPNPACEGYRFLGWAQDKGAAAAQWTAGESCGTVDQDTTLYGVWVIANGTDHTVTFLQDEAGAVWETVSVEDGYDLTIPGTAPTKEGYRFVRWDGTDPSGGAVSCMPGDTIAVLRDSWTFRPVWEEDPSYAAPEGDAAMEAPASDGDGIAPEAEASAEVSAGEGADPAQ